MKTKRLSIILALCAILGFSANAHAILFDLSGTGNVTAAVDVIGFDFAPDSAIALLNGSSTLPFTQGQVFTLYTQGLVTSYTTSDNVIHSLAPTDPQFTAVVGFQEVVTGTGTIGNQQVAAFAQAPGSPNFYQMYYDPNQATAASNNLSNLTSGLYYGKDASAISVLTGEVTTSSGNFSVFNPTLGLLDQFGSDDTNGKTTTQLGGGMVSGEQTVAGPSTGGANGSNSLAASIDPIDVNRNFWIGVPTDFGLTVNIASNQALPFLHANPAINYWTGATYASLDGLGAIIGPTNGLPNGTSNAILIEVDASQSESLAAVPEPSTLLLLGLGLTGFAFIGRKTRSKLS